MLIGAVDAVKEISSVSIVWHVWECPYACARKTMPTKLRALAKAAIWYELDLATGSRFCVRVREIFKACSSVNFVSPAVR